jgi:hypothetical protein
MDIDSMIAVLQAYKDGKRIQAIDKQHKGAWNNCQIPLWDFQNNDYRVQPEPREIWITDEQLQKLFSGQIGCANAYFHPDVFTKKIVFREVL